MFQKKAIDYPFAITSTNKSSKTKGLFLGISSGIFVILLSISLLRTILCDPGYFPSPLDLEYQIVIKNLMHEQEIRESEEKENKEESIKNGNPKNENNLEKEIFDNNNENNEIKKNFFKVDYTPKEKPVKNKEHLKLKRNPSEKIYFDTEKSIEIHREEALNLINFSNKISETPICYEEYNKRSDFLDDWTYKVNIKESNQEDNSLLVKSNLNGAAINEDESLSYENNYKKELKNGNEVELDMMLNNQRISGENKIQKEKEIRKEELDYSQTIFDGYIGYDVGKAFLCGSCVRLKVERSHHCKQCGKCVLKMDHHCPWLANCIGYKNYKFFLLTHLYGTISCSIVLGSYWETFVNATFNDNISIIILSWHLFIFVCTLGLLSFLVWLLFVNWNLMFHSLTVIENADRERFPSAKFNNNFDLGYYRNFKGVFGENPFLWFLPILPNDKYKGLYFEKNDVRHEKLMMLI